MNNRTKEQKKVKVILKAEFCQLLSFLTKKISEVLFYFVVV